MTASAPEPRRLIDALDHIARSAAQSRSQTRRLRWIERRASMALCGEDYNEAAFDLPKSAGPDTHEKLLRRMNYHIAVKMQLLEAAQKAMAECCDLTSTEAGDALQAAIDNALEDRS